ncbi:transposase [Elizabethkingia anophelis]|nr:transposase [Elizabethkingia anophelis]MCT4063408.1 transposase [Elizabethkingia anophelis]MCT4109700.1 transposase [Elizabethkingia anophelis]
MKKSKVAIPVRKHYQPAKTKFGESIIEISRDREESFEPIIIPKHQSTATPVENIIISLYVESMSISDIE